MIVHFAKAVRKISEEVKKSTLADLATFKGMIVAQFQDKVLAAVKAELDQAVKNGNLTQASADQAYSNVEQRIKSNDWANQLGRGGWGFRGQGPLQAQSQQ